MDIKVIVATHKQYRMPSDNCYMPLHVGKQVDFNQYYEFQRRMFGRVSELLLNVWIEQKQYNYQCVLVDNIEKSNLHKRIPAFLKAKFLNKKYSGSF